MLLLWFIIFLVCVRSLARSEHCARTFTLIVQTPTVCWFVSVSCGAVVAVFAKFLHNTYDPTLLSMRFVSMAWVDSATHPWCFHIYIASGAKICTKYFIRRGTYVYVCLCVCMCICGYVPTEYSSRKRICFLRTHLENLLVS